MESTPTETTEQMSLGEVAPDGDTAAEDALLDEIAEENINAQTAALPTTDEPVAQDDEQPHLAAEGANITDDIIDPDSSPSEEEIVQDIDTLLADISGIAEGESSEPVEDKPAEIEPEDLAEADPEALLEAADELAAAGGTRLDGDIDDEQAGPPSADAGDLDATLAARAEELESEEEPRLDETAPETADQDFVPISVPDASAEREALLDDPAPAVKDVAAAVEPTKPSRRRPLAGVAGWVMDKLIHLVEAPIAKLSKDARYTVSFLAVTFLLGSVMLLVYALFFAH